MATVPRFWRTKAGNEVDLAGRITPEATCRLLYRDRESLEIDGIRCLPCEDFLRGLIPGQPVL